MPISNQLIKNKLCLYRITKDWSRCDYLYFILFILILRLIKTQRLNCQHPLDYWKSNRVPGKSISPLLTMPKPLTVWITINCGKFGEMGKPDHLICLLRNLYAGQEATVKSGHGTTDWFQIGKGVCQGYIWSPCLFNLYAEYIMRNAGLDEAQAGTNIARRNIKLHICRWHHPYGRKWRTIASWWKWKRRVKKLA